MTERPVRPLPALLVLCLGNFAILLDTTIVNTAAPSIMTALDASVDDLLWVINAYLLAFATLLILCGRIGDLIGARTAFVLGLGLFSAASAVCGLASSPGGLIGARVLQGVGAAMLAPQALVLIGGIFPAHRRGAAFGVFGAVTGLAAISGPALGGLLVTTLDWSWIFFLNIPIGVLAVVATLLIVPDLRGGSRHRLDVVGVLAASAGLFCVTFALIEGERYGWGRIAGPISIPVVAGAGVLLLVGLLFWERRRGPDALVPMTLFRVRNFGLATAINGTAQFALLGFLLTFVLVTQSMLGMTALESGLTALPMTLVMSGVAVLAGRLVDRIGGQRVLLVGLLAFATGVAGTALVSRTSATALAFVPPLIAAGVGLGFVVPAMITEALRHVPAAQSGAASGVLNTSRQLGGALGAAVAGAVLQNRLLAAMQAAADRGSAEIPARYEPQLRQGIDSAARHGLHLGSGQQTGGVQLSGDVPDPVADQLSAAIHRIYLDAFASAVRPTLAVLVAVLLISALAIVGAGLARRRARVDATEPRLSADATRR